MVCWILLVLNAGLITGANRNTTAHDYGEGFANETLKILPDFLKDVREFSLGYSGFI